MKPVHIGALHPSRYSRIFSGLNHKISYRTIPQPVAWRSLHHNRPCHVPTAAFTSSRPSSTLIQTVGPTAGQSCGHHLSRRYASLCHKLRLRRRAPTQQPQMILMFRRVVGGQAFIQSLRPGHDTRHAAAQRRRVPVVWIFDSNHIFELISLKRVNTTSAGSWL